MEGPTSAGHICNDKDNKCDYLDSWYNGGMSAYGRCEKGAWEGIKQWPPHQGCETPLNCSLLKKVIKQEGTWGM